MSPAGRPSGRPGRMGAADARPAVSVVVAAFDQWEHIARCLESLRSRGK